MAENPSRVQAIVSALERDLDAVHVEVVDESAQHAGHAWAAGGGHFRILVVSERFEGRSRLEAQRLVYRALDPLMGGAIHALTMTTLTPDQWHDQKRDEGPKS